MSIPMMHTVLADYFKTQPVLKAWLFGSYARGEENPLSDVDLLVQYDGDGVSLLKHAAMMCELEDILGRPVDLVEEGTLRPRIKESVNQDRKLIYERATTTKNLEQTARLMKTKGYSVTDISEITGLSAEDIEEL